jgi:hypothetical protein
MSFQKLVTTANHVATKFNGARDTCVLTMLTSFALHDVLQRLRPLRIEAAHPSCSNVMANHARSRGMVQTPVQRHPLMPGSVLTGIGTRLS